MNESLAEACYRMGTSGGYVLAFSRRVPTLYPGITWATYRNTLLANGHGFCGYAESAVRRAFEAGQKEE